MNAPQWKPDEPIGQPGTWLLEASAGTGKTHQISGLFVRLVAELGMPVHRIMAITFTNAATAELRDRIRLRLQEVRRVLAADPDAPSQDPVVAHLRSLGDPDRRVLRLDLALRDFDQAPISTIHGFAQRTLQELAFESRQDPDLELVSTALPVMEQLVDDDLARFFVEATAPETALFRKLGVQRNTLLKTVKSVSAAAGPRIVPEGHHHWGEYLLTARARFERLAEARRRWTEDFAAARSAFVNDGAAGYFAEAAGDVSNRLKAADAWLAKAPGRVGYTAPRPALSQAYLSRHWRKKGTPGPVESRPWWPMVGFMDEVLKAEAAFDWSRMTPLAGFASTFRSRLEQELDRRQLLTFDGILTRLERRITAADGTVLAEQLRSRYDAVFVDEFQDTDSAQWNILQTAFHGHRHLFLIGDPKQAIYAFRGADVHVYLEAASVVSQDSSSGGRRTMAQNWRSDPAAVKAMNVLWRPGSGAFNVPGIDFVRIEDKLPTRLEPAGPGLDLRWLDARVHGGPPGTALTQNPLGLAARLAAEEALAWIRGERSRIIRSAGAEPSVPLPGDLAILVDSHSQAQMIRRELRRLRIPAVSASKRSVFHTPAARWIATWLDAVAAGGRDQEARTAAVSPLVGWTADELAWSLALAERGDEARKEARRAGLDWPADDAPLHARRDWNIWTERLRRAAERWPKHGFARTFDRELSELQVFARLLAAAEGERHATDLRHLIELLHTEERTRRHGPGPLANWLRAQQERDGNEFEQRLESDENAVRVETVHVSKGLQYPIVLLPFVWSTRRKKSAEFTPLQARVAGVPVVDLSAPKTEARLAAHASVERERSQESIRHLYVALTRAQHRTVAWWGATDDSDEATRHTSLGRLIMRQGGASDAHDAVVADFKQPDQAWPLVQERLDDLARRSEGTVAWSPAEPPASPRPWSSTDAPVILPEWPSDRPLPHISGRWLVTSYSGLAPAAAVRDDDEKHAETPESLKAATMDVVEPEESDPVSDAGSTEPMGVAEPADVTEYDLPHRLTAGRGTTFGTFVHEVYERIDFAAFGPATSGATSGPSSPDPFRDVVESAGVRNGFPADSAVVADVLRHLPATLHTPLDAPGAHASDPGGIIGLPPGFHLALLGARDRLNELDFDLRIGSGTRERIDPEREDGPLQRLDARPGCVDPRRVYAVLEQARGQTRFQPWVDAQLRRRSEGAPLIPSITGILTGSIDLVFRVGRGPDARYFVADYKTNRIGAARPGHYEGPWLDREMMHAGYVLQSLIYTVALHRHLSQRLGHRYSYERNVGGALYLFVRGMAGPLTPRCPRTGQCLGVHTHRWPAHVVAALDAALAPRQELP